MRAPSRLFSAFLLAHLAACGARGAVETTTVVVTPLSGATATQGGAVSQPQAQLQPIAEPSGEPPCVEPGPDDQVAALPPVVAVGAGGARSCSAHQDGRVCCWGKRVSAWWTGRDGAERVRPVRMENVRDGVAFALGEMHNCVLTRGGEVYCWGRNNQHQLGNGTDEHHGVPIPVPGLQKAALLATGGIRSCAVLDDGRARCWGMKEAVPRRIERLEGIKTISMGDTAGCVTRADGSFACFDSKLLFIYRLADRDGAGFDTIKGLRGLSDLVMLNRENACAVKGGQLWCFGRTYGEGKVFERMSGRQKMVATRFSDLDDVVQLASSGHYGGGHHCAVRGDGSVWCWGKNGDGQLGDGTTVDRTVPVQVVDLAEAVEVSLGERHSCARRRDGAVLCWGDNRFGQLGDGTKTASPVPVEVRW